MIGRWMEDLAWPEAGRLIAAGWPVLVPIGARSKEHGHHLPLSTDYRYVLALCDRVVERLPVLIAPIVDFGYYPAFLNYPGSQHLRAETFIALLTDILEQFLAQGVRRLAIVNLGVSTEAPVQIVARDMLVRHGVQTPVADIGRMGRSSRRLLEQKLGGHADEAETSVMLVVAPELVDLAQAVPDYGHLLTEPASVFVAPVTFSGDPASGTNYSAHGARGDPTLATAEKGRAILADMVDELVAGLMPLCVGASP